MDALQVIALRARPDRVGRLVTSLSGRDIAAELGVGRDAATKAVAVLRDRGLLRVEEQRTSNGRFRRNALVVDVPLLADTKGPAAGKAQRRAPHSPTPTLFDTDAEPTPNNHALPHHEHDNAENHHDHDTQPHPSEPTKRLPEQPHALAFRNALDDDAPDGARC